MAVGLTDITVAVSDVCTITVVSADIVAVVDSEGATCTVLFSSAWAVSCGNRNRHRANSAVMNADRSINSFISFPLAD
jgi:hypothetical protein